MLFWRRPTAAAPPTGQTIIVIHCFPHLPRCVAHPLIMPAIAIRPALPADIDIVMHHRRAMFEDMGEGTPASLDTMMASCRPWFLQAMANGGYRGWLAQQERKIVAGGGVLLTPFPANPHSALNLRATILNVYTEPAYRRRGLARRLMQVMIDWSREQGLAAVFLHASHAGRPLYESLGFTGHNEMKLSLAGSE
jgi:GNAT superfamily N-acetyltransferase